PSFGLVLPHLEDADERRVFCRAFNAYVADSYRLYADRLTPAAVIPLHTPDEGVEELSHAVESLGLKAAMIPTYVRRPVRALGETNPSLGMQAGTLDTFGVDSEY